LLRKYQCMKNVLPTFGLALLMITGCSSTTTSSARGMELRIRYAEVAGIERVKMPSAAPAGAIVGGFTGLVLSSGKSTGRQVASGAAGAALGALATSALEGDRLGYSYTLNYPDGSSSRFITEKGYLQLGDCVAVERGEYANIRRVPEVMCNGKTVASVDPAHSLDAQQCHEAKSQLLAAGTSEEIEAASRKVQIICDY